jgi:hypothetical protein
LFDETLCAALLAGVEGKMCGLCPRHPAADGGGDLESYTPAGSGTVNFNLQPRKSIIKKSTHSKQSDKPSMNSYGIKLESRKGIFGSLRFLAGKIPHGKAARISSQTSNLPFNYY